MIIFLRNMMHKGNVYKIFLWVFLLMFVGGGFGLSQMGKKPFALKVYGDVISQETLASTTQRLQQQHDYYKSQGVTFAGKNIKKEAVKALVQDSLEKHLVDQMHVHVDPVYLKKTIDEQLSSLPDALFNAKGQLDAELFKKYIGEDLDVLLDKIEHSIKRELLNEVIDLSRYTSQFELKAQYNKEYADKSIEILAITPVKHIAQAKEKAVSEEELAKFYKTMKNKDQFKTKEQRAAQYWIFDQGAYDVSVSDKEAKREYDRCKNEKYFIAPAEVQVRKIFLNGSADNSSDAKDRLKILREEVVANPKSFADVAKKSSEDKETAANGGLMPFFAKDSKNHDAVIVKKAFESLVEDGQISDVLKVKNGYAILQRVSRKKASYKPFDSVKKELQAELLKNKFEQRFMQDAQRMVSSVKYKPEALQSFVDKHHGSQRSITLSAREASLVFTRLFQTDLFKYNVFIDEKGNGIVLHCTKIEAAAFKPLDEVRDKIKDAYYVSQGEKLMRREIDVIFTIIDNGRSFQEIAQGHGLKYEQAETKYKNGQRVDDAPLKNPTIQQKMGMLQYPGDIVEVEMAHAHALLKLVRLEEHNQELFADKKRDMMQTLHYAEKYQKRDSFIASLSKNAIIKKEIEIKEEFKPKVDDL